MAILNSLGSAVKSGFSSLARDLTGDQVDLFFKDSEQTAYNFGQKSNHYLENYPRLKFQYFVKIKFNELAKGVYGKNGVNGDNGEAFYKRFLGDREVAMIVPLTRSVQLPGMTIETKQLNQYNHWRNSQTKIKYDPITMEMHDVVDGKTLRFWEMYFEYYFKDASGVLPAPQSGNAFIDSVADIVAVPVNKLGVRGAPQYGEETPYSSGYDPQYGYNLEGIQDQKHLIDYIEIYQYHASRWSMVHIARPVISKFQHDTLAYSEIGDTVKMTYTFEYEHAQYHNFYTLFDLDHEEERTGAKELWQASNNLALAAQQPTPHDFQVRRRTLDDPYELDVTNGAIPRTSVLGNLTSDIGDIIQAGPGALGDAVAKKVTTGEWEAPFDAEQIGKDLFDRAETGVKTVSTKNLSATVKNATKSFIDVKRR